MPTAQSVLGVPFWILFVIGAALSWGAYVPTIHASQKAMQMAGLKAFLFVGLAYCVTAVFIPSIAIWGANVEAEKVFTTKGAWLGTLAGVLGAAGALCVIFAIKNGGMPLYVAPLVFAGAPIVNVIISTALHPPAEGLASINPLLYVGFLLASAGAGMVLYFKPA